MPRTLNKRKKTHVAEIVRHGEKLILPEGLSLKDAMQLLHRRAEYEETEVDISQTFNVFPLDGAYGLSQVIIRRYGWQESKPIVSLFGEQPPQIMQVPSGPNSKVDVPWGHFNLPNVEGTLVTSIAHNSAGQAVF